MICISVVPVLGVTDCAEASTVSLVGLTRMLGHGNRGLGSCRHVRHEFCGTLTYTRSLRYRTRRTVRRRRSEPTLISCSDIGLTRRHNAIERRRQSFEALLGNQPIDIRLRRFDLRDIGIQLKLRWSTSCVDTASVSAAIASAWPDLGQLGIGLGDVQFGPRLHELLVEVGRVDFGEQLTGFDLAADVVFPALQIARYAGIDRRPDVRFQAARAAQSPSGSRIAGSDQRDIGHRLRLGQIVQSRTLRRARDQAEGDDADHQNQKNMPDDELLRATLRRLGGGTMNFSQFSSERQRP